MKRISTLMLCLIMIISFTASCGKADKGSDSGKVVSFTDSAGRVVEVPANITRVAASGSLAQIVLFSLAPEMLVGTSSDWSESALPYIDEKYSNLPVIGQFYGTGDLNLEQVAALDPQIIIDVGEAKSGIVEDMDGIMEQVGIPTVHIEASLYSMADAYRKLGELLNLKDRAETLALYCESVIARTNEIAEQVGQTGKIKLLYCLGEDGLNVIANGSFHAQVIDLLSDNLAVVSDPSSKGSGNPVDMEQLLNWNPDVIIFAPGSIYNTVGRDSTWKNLSAIANGKYYEVPEGPYNWMGFPPSVNRYLGMIWLSQLLYPETANYDMLQEMKSFYNLFYHCELTDEQCNSFIANSLVK